MRLAVRATLYPWFSPLSPNVFFPTGSVYGRGGLVGDLYSALLVVIDCGLQLPVGESLHR